MNRERKGCHIHSELVRAFSLWYAPVPGCDKFRLVLPMFSCRYVDEIQKLSRPFKYATPFPRGLSRVDVAERLRRQTANLIPSGCAGSNPVINVFVPSFLFLFPSSTSPLFFFLCGCWHHKQESRLSCYEYSSSERLARAGRHPPSTRPLLCRCVVAPPRILSLTKCRRPLSSHICTCLLSARAGKAVTLPRRFEIVRPFTGLRKAAWPRKSSPAPASQPASLPQ